ncbi:hypothetical protein KLEP181_gp61 [Paracoccus phage vB_PmaP_KLEP18-1]|nr:hypothetical protein KLEP181_gp61 [Paracoccus phage vB_PmaP_KLEP18-1]
MIIPYFRDYPNPQPAFTDDVHDMIRERMSRQSEQAGTQPRGWGGRPVGAAAGIRIDLDEIRQMHDAGMTIQQIADATGRSLRGCARSVEKIKLARGQAKFGSTINAQKRRDARDAMRPDVARMLRAGMLKRDIARSLKVSMDTIRRIIAEGVDGSS